jgi:hypothetical protein
LEKKKEEEEGAGVRRIKSQVYLREILGLLEEKALTKKEKKKKRRKKRKLTPLKSIKSHMCFSHVLGHLSANFCPIWNGFRIFQKINNNLSFL